MIGSFQSAAPIRHTDEGRRDLGWCTSSAFRARLRIAKHATKRLKARFCTSFFSCGVRVGPFYTDLATATRLTVLPLGIERERGEDGQGEPELQ